VGGCVRDMVMGREPKDYDVATDARPEQVLHLFPKADLVGAHFGVVMVRDPDHAQVEVATFRSDASYADGRHPDRVEFENDVRRDVRRRDFTINALLMDPTSGEVLDFVEGRRDIEQRRIRAIGDPQQRFEEDHLRMLRAVRFAARFEFEIEPATFHAIRSRAERVRRVAAERVRDELVHILTEGQARRGFELLDDTGLLVHILPEVAAMKGVEQPPQYHPEGDVWTHTLMALERLEQPTPTLALGVLLHDVGKPPTFRRAPDRIRFDGHDELGARMAVQILNRLRFSRHDVEQVEALVAQHMRFKDVERMRESTLKRFLRLPRFDEHLELHRIDCEASHRQLDHYLLVKDRLEQYAQQQQQLRPPPLLTGHDLIQAGYQPGPIFSEVLRTVEDAQLEARIGTREEALRLVAENFPLPEAGLDPKPPGR
jgi:putative nucleotidyltransferase with HDIG domain